MRVNGRRGVWSALVCGALLGASSGAAAQDTVEDLKKTVEELSQMLQDAMKRLTELEEQQKETAEAVKSAPPAAAPADAQARPKDSLDVFWKEGIRLETPADENGVQPFKLRISGRIQNDWFWGESSSDLDTIDSVENGVEFRRARIALSGTIYKDFLYHAEFGFGSATEFNDVFMGVQNVPYAGTIRVGRYKEFAGLDELTSDNDTLFIERALPNVFAPGRNIGVAANNAFFDQRMTVGLGLFHNTDAFGFGEGDQYAFTGRVTGLPWRSEDGENVVHIGVWGGVRATDSDDFRVRQRPEIHLAPRYLDTFDEIGEIDGIALFGVDAGVTHGRFSAMGEYMMQSLDRPMGDVTFWGAYVQGAVFLTDDHRGYRAADGFFDKVKPKKNVQIGKDGGWGAWEVALRYSHLDLDDGGVNAGTMDDITAGVNWFLNPNLRWSLNYVHAWVERDSVIVFQEGTADEETFPAVDGDFDGVVTRFQVTW